MNGIQLIEAERKRQIRVEKWTPEHDDNHSESQLALAAACYALPIGKRNETADPRGHENTDTFVSRLWPWAWEWWKPVKPYSSADHISREVSSIAARIRELTKAGALIAAEIDRLNRQTVGTILERTMDPDGRR